VRRRSRQVGLRNGAGGIQGAWWLGLRGRDLFRVFAEVGIGDDLGQVVAKARAASSPARAFQRRWRGWARLTIAVTKPTTATTTAAMIGAAPLPTPSSTVTRMNTIAPTARPIPSTA